MRGASISGSSCATSSAAARRAGCRIAWRPSWPRFWCSWALPDAGWSRFPHGAHSSRRCAGFPHRSPPSQLLSRDHFHHGLLRDYERAEALAAHALELGKKHQLPNPTARSLGSLGRARAQLGRATEGVALIRQGLAALREIGTRMGITASIANLAEAQALEGAIWEALETIEQALNAN